jgi:ABC-type sugar transport system substrate-binding protein
MRRTLATITLASSLVFMPSTANAEDTTPITTICQVYIDQSASWKAAYERASEEAMQYLTDGIVLGMKIDRLAEKNYNKRLKIQALRALLKENGIKPGKIILFKE